MNSKIQADAATQPDSPDHIEAIFKRQKISFSNSPMPLPAERKRSLATLKALLIEHKDALASAINADFTARSTDETMLVEILPCIQFIDYTVKHLCRWMKPAKRRAGLYFLPAKARVVYQPLGVVGIIVPFNYPLNLAIVPLITALSAGNRAMLKMSEYTPQTSLFMANMLRKGFTEDQVAVVAGDADVAAAFTRLPFDHLFFTGSTAIGKLVMHEAAANLTPVTLELGGKSPAIIADDIPLQDIIDRLCFAKSINAGQTCVAPDYVLVPRGKQELFIQLYTAAFLKMFPAINGNKDYTSMIHAHSRQLLQDWLQDAAEKGARIIKIGDEIINDGTFRMPMHLVSNVTDEMKIMQKELFGPILPVVPYDNIQEALDYVNQRPHPLALYLFTYDRDVQERVTCQTQAGTMCINEALIHAGVNDLPFGGIGASGIGQYHGQEGFLAMSRAKSILSKGKLNSTKLIYPPYGGIVQKWLVKWLTR